MGFALTVLYTVLAIFSPDQFGREWSSAHLLTVIGVLALVVSLPTMLTHRQLDRSVQTYLLVGFTGAICLSWIAHGWFGGAVQGAERFLANAFIFFLVAANVTTARRLRILALAIVCACLVVAMEGTFSYFLDPGNRFVLHRAAFANEEIVRTFLQIRGVGFLNDPNDFGQVLLMALPLAFFSWRQGRGLSNFFWVFLPSALLLWGIYLTHSRGSMVGLLVIVVMAVRTRLPRSASVALVALLMIVLLGTGFTSGRSISIDQGSDRFEAWSTGLQLFKRAPVFGVGFGAFTDFNEITAHNSIVLCLAELGLVGTTFWVAMLVTTVMGLIRLMERAKNSSPATGPPDAPGSTSAQSDLPGKTFLPSHWIAALRLSMVSFIVTSWFLSRSYTFSLYLFLGLSTAAIAMQRPAVRRRERGKWVLVTLLTEGLAILAVYSFVRIRWAFL